MDEREKDIKQRFDRLANELNERTRRLLAASEAMTIGRGGITLVSRATGLSRKSISLGRHQATPGEDEHQSRAYPKRRRGTQEDGQPGSQLR
jgi:hypothetical protein